MDGRFEQALHGVIDEALQRACLSSAERRSMGFFLGSSCGEMPVLEAHYRRDLQISNDALPMLQSSSLGNLVNRLRLPFGIQGPDYSYYTACTASANALLGAAHMLRTGRLRHAIVVGVEMFNAVTALGFAGLQLITHDVMRPFDRARAGLVPGEGCAAVVLSVEPSDSDWTLLGGANLCDTYSISATNPDGSAIAGVVQQAFAASGVTPADLAALKMHGTASLLNDEAEAAGLHRVFSQLPPLCALKPYIGHTYGACGVVELALLCASINRGRLPATPGIAADSDLDVTLNQTRKQAARGKFMLNYFGFGGSNSSLIVANEPQADRLPPAPRTSGTSDRTEESRAIYIASAADYVEQIDRDVVASDLKSLVADAVGTPVRRIGRFIQLALIGAGRCAKPIDLPTQTAVYLGSARGDLEVAIEVMQTLVRDGHAPKPLSFINTVSNAASFYVAQCLNLMSRSTFVCNRYFAFETMLQLAALDLGHSAVETALVGTVDIVMPPLAGHRIRLGLDGDTPVADASHWLFLQSQPTQDTLGRLLVAESFVDASALRAWLGEQVFDSETWLACGQFMPHAEVDAWHRELQMQSFDYRAGRAYYDSQSGAAIGEFLRRSRGTLLHLNRDPSGRYSAVIVEAMTRN
jgi:3-oxoacyl-(acyl-carrier-protein) synthase